MKTPFIHLVLLGACLLGAPALRASPRANEPSASDKLGFVFSNEIVSSGDTELKAGDSKYQHVAFLHSHWNLSRTIPTGETSALTLGLAYNLSVYRVSEPADWEDDDEWEAYKQANPDWERVPLPKRLQSLAASLEYSSQINDRWSFTSNVSFGSYVAGKKILSEGWGAAASVMGLYKWSPNVTVAIGAAYDSLSHDYRFVPLIGVDWQINPKWSASIGFPSTAVTYAFRENLTFSVEASGAGGTFHVQEEPAPGITPRELAGSKLDTLEIRLGLKAVWRINDTFSISAGTGHVVYREFKYIDRDYRLKSRDMSGYGSLGGSISF